MHTVEMLSKDDIIEEEFFAKIAPRVRQNLGSFIAGRVTVLNMTTQLLNVVDTLLADENCATLETDLTKRLLMCFFHMAPQTLFIGEMLFSRTICH